MHSSEAEIPEQPRTRLRCAIYTRKSTEEGLEQEFNTLHAQREAALAFIRSQQHEGWIALPEMYDDGGFTGAHMDRPALTRLLHAVEAGELDCVVVYKVDRLSRSLLDFTRMLSVFEKHGVSFVAVTQQFNTSTSLGRLTLNILLSFAQFERELIGERTRDKMSAARRKGKWVGGCPVLGYDVDPRGGRLAVNEDEAERVRALFALFAEHRSMRVTLAEIERRGWRLKSWMPKTGRFHAGGPFSPVSLRRLLTNILYTGALRHKGQCYPGEHAAIIAPDAWERVQDLITHQGACARGGGRNKHQALLSGLLYCECCAARMREHDLGDYIEASSERLGAYLDRWLETAAKPKLKERTFHDYKNLLNRYVRPALDQRQISKISPLDIQGVYQDILDRGLSARSVRYTHAVLRSALDQAVKWRMLSRNPAEAVELPKNKRKEIRVLNTEQARAFLKASASDRLGALFALAITAGPRPSEYLALKWADFDPETGTIRIVRTLDWVRGGGWEFADTKRARSRRTIKLQAHVTKALLQHAQLQQQMRIAAGDRWTEHGLIFTTKTGTPLDERNVAQQDFVRVLKSSGLPVDFRLYDQQS